MQPSRQLILLRHAKSSWKDASLPDDERPLAPRGRRALVLVAQHLRASDITVDLVLCSPARRTRQTWDGLRAGLRAAPEVRFVRELYEATGSELLDVLNRVDRHFGAVLLIGHNPGIADLAGGLVSGGGAEPLKRLQLGFPTAALATLSSELDWADLGWQSARLEDFLRPRDLSPG
jgi:phosphohistidine phosphatase